MNYIKFRNSLFFTKKSFATLFCGISNNSLIFRARMNFFSRERAFKNANSNIFVFKSPGFVSRTVSLFPRGYPFESLAKANSRWKVISVYGARLISYRSRIFIAATRTRARICARMPARGTTRGCGREIEYDRKGGKTQRPRYFVEGLNRAGDEANVGSATVHTLCFTNCGTEETDIPLSRLFLQ